MGLIRWLYRLFNRLFYKASGRKPWSRGYIDYRRVQILKGIDRGEFDTKTLPAGYGFRLDERVIEYSWFFSRLPCGAGRLLDAGSILNFEEIIRQKKIKEKDLVIATLAPEVNCFADSNVTYVYEDLRRSSLEDNFFDWVVSISTIEHIGMDNTLLYTDDTTKKECEQESYLDAIREFSRVLKKGGVLYLTFPFGKRANYGWLQFFDSLMLDQIIETFSPASVIESHFRYEIGGWRPSTREESQNATYFDIHNRDDYDADFAAASRAIVTLELTK